MERHIYVIQFKDAKKDINISTILGTENNDYDD